MKGLLIKDLKLIMHNKKILIVQLAVLLLVLQNYDGYSFLIGYVTMVFVLLVLSTISLDEYCKSSTFLMTLPVKRETYVVEKYILMLGFSLLGALFSTLVCILLHRELLWTLLTEALAIYVAMTFIQLLMLPVQLKFGGEKGRIVLIGFLAAIWVAIMFFAKTVDFLNMQGTIGNSVKNAGIWFISLPVWGMGLIVGLLFCGGVAASYLVSRGIMRRREF